LPKAIDAALGFTPEERLQTTQAFRALLPSIGDAGAGVMPSEASTFAFAGAALPMDETTLWPAQEKALEQALEST
jgi:hypothetical protein